MKIHCSHPSAAHVEVLESRIAPATLTGKVLTYTDIDGDKVTITFSKGTLDASMFSFSTGSVNGDNNASQQLWLIDLSTASDISGADITVKVTRAGNGDGFAAIGRINAGSYDLGKVTIQGDLGQIDAGSGSANIPAIKALVVQSMGRYGVATQNPSSTPDLTSDIVGSLGPVTAKGSIEGAYLHVTGGSAGSGSIGAVKIGGSLVGTDSTDSGLIRASGNIASVTISKNIAGKGGTASGRIDADGLIGPIKIGGSIYGGSGDSSAQINAKRIASLTVTGSIVGGSGPSSASFYIGDGSDTAGIGPVKIGGNLQGGTGATSANLYVNGTVASISIGGSVIGGDGESSAWIYSAGNLGSLNIAGSLVGSSGNWSGIIGSTGRIGAITIKRDFIGGTGDYSAIIYTNDASDGDIASVSIGGSMFSGGGAEPGIFSQRNIGAVKVNGSIQGMAGELKGMYITAQGDLNPEQGVVTPPAIGSVTVKGSAAYTNILAGWSSNSDVNTSATNGNVTIGNISVAGDWVASTVSAGIENLGADHAAGGTGADTDNINFGNNDDQVIPTGPVGITSRIASIIVGGSVFGTAASGDHFGFLASQFGSIKIGGATVVADHDTTQLAPLTGDVTVHLVTVPV